MKKVHWIGAILGAIVGLIFGCIAKNILVSVTSGLWSVEEGAPWIAIYAVIIVPVAFGFAHGLNYGAGYGLLTGIVSPFVTAVLDYFTCIIIGIFSGGDATALAISILVLVALLAGPGRTIFAFVFRE